MTAKEEKVVSTVCSTHCGGICLLKVYVVDGVITKIETDDGKDPHSGPASRAGQCGRGFMPGGVPIQGSPVSERARGTDGEMRPLPGKVGGGEKARLCGELPCEGSGCRSRERSSEKIWSDQRGRGIYLFLQSKTIHYVQAKVIPFNFRFSGHIRGKISQLKRSRPSRLDTALSLGSVREKSLV